MSETNNSEPKAALILATIGAIEGTFVVLNYVRNGLKVWAYLGFSAGKSGTLGGLDSCSD